MKQTRHGDITAYSFNIFDKYPKVLNIVSTRHGGVSKSDFSSLNIAFHVGDEPNLVLENRKLLAEAIHISPSALTCGEQVHGAQVEVVTAKVAGRGSGSLENAFVSTDSLVTNVSNIPLMVQTADCAPVSFYDPIAGTIGIAHTGRKGAEKEIVPKTIEKMADTYGTEAKNLLVGIGPCIHSCCYDIDIPKQIRIQLLMIGVKPKNIEESGICTSCHNKTFFSYRADNKKTGRFANIIMLHK